MRLAWITHTRLDCLYDINQIAQIPEKIFNEERKEVIGIYNKSAIMATEFKPTLRFPKLDIESLKILGFSDASFANNRDLSSQLGYILFLSDKS